MVSFLCNDKISNVLKWLQIVYKSLKEGGKWLVVAYSSFEKNQIELTFQEFRHIVGKSQFRVLVEERGEEFIIASKGSLLQEKAVVHYLLLEK